MKVQDFLRNYGFTANKAELYCALLKRRSGSASELAQAAGIQRTTAYDILRELCDENLAVMSFAGSKRIYHANPPEEMQNRLMHQLNQLELLLPSLQALFFHQEQLPRIRYYEGPEGIIQVYEETLEVESKEYFYFGGMIDFAQSVGREYMSNFIRRRIRKKIWSNGIRIRESEIPDPETLPGEENYRRVRYISCPGVTPMAHLTLFDRKIAITSTARENYAMVIESEELFSMLKIFWDYIWSTASEP